MPCLCLRFRAQHILRNGDLILPVLFRVVERRVGARVLGERLRREIAEMGLTKENGEKLAVTVSIGVAIFPLPNPAEVPSEQVGKKLVELADAALYRAKNAGRNRVEL